MSYILLILFFVVLAWNTNYDYIDWSGDDPIFFEEDDDNYFG